MTLLLATLSTILGAAVEDKLIMRAAEHLACHNPQPTATTAVPRYRWGIAATIALNCSTRT